MEYRVGSIIEYLSFGNDRRTVKVDAKDENIKNDRPGFSGVEVQRRTYRTETGIAGRWEKTGDEWWGYDYQITRVIEF